MKRPVECFHGVPFPRVAPAHDCREYLDYYTSTSTEPHGESFDDEWWRCNLCGSIWTERDLEKLNAA